MSVFCRTEYIVDEPISYENELAHREYFEENYVMLIVRNVLIGLGYVLK